MWAIICHYQLAPPILQGGGAGADGEGAILEWLRAALPGCKVHNLDSSWNDGQNLSALVDFCQPGLIPDHASLKPENRLENVKHAMMLAEENLSIPQVMHPEDLAMDKPDKLSTMTYLSQFCCPNSVGEKKLLDWVQRKLPHQNITNFTTDWVDGRVLESIANITCSYEPESANASSTDTCNEAMIALSSLLQAPPLIQPSEFTNASLDPRLRMAYLLSIYSSTHPPRVISTSLPERVGGAEEVEVDVEVGELGSVEGTVARAGGGSTRVVVGPVQSGRCLVKVAVPARDVYTINLRCGSQLVKGCPLIVDLDAYSLKHIGTTMPRKVGDPCILIFDTSEINGKPLQVKGVGKTSGELSVEVDASNEGKCCVSFTPLQPDTFTLTLEVAGKRVKESPLVLPLLSLVEPQLVVCGKMEHCVGGEVRVPVDCRRAGRGVLTASCKGMVVGEVAVAVASSDGVPTGVSFTAPTDDVFLLSMQYEGEEVPKSPLSIDLRNLPPQSDKVSVTQAPNGTREIGREICIIFDAFDAGSGQMVASCAGTLSGDVPVAIKTVGFSRYSVSFFPKQQDNYFLQVEYGGKSVPGAPFQLSFGVKPQDAGKCILQGLEHSPTMVKVRKVWRGLLRREIAFRVNGKRAGRGVLEANVETPAGTSEPLPTSQSQDSMLWHVSYTPQQLGVHRIHMLWSGTPIPASPLVFEVVEPTSFPLGSPVELEVEVEATKQLNAKAILVTEVMPLKFNAEIKKHKGKSNTVSLSLPLSNPGTYLVRVYSKYKELACSPLLLVYGWQDGGTSAETTVNETVAKLPLTDSPSSSSSSPAPLASSSSHDIIVTEETQKPADGAETSPSSVIPLTTEEATPIVEHNHHSSALSPPYELPPTARPSIDSTFSQFSDRGDLSDGSHDHLKTHVKIYQSSTKQVDPSLNLSVTNDDIIVLHDPSRSPGPVVEMATLEEEGTLLSAPQLEEVKEEEMDLEEEDKVEEKDNGEDISGTGREEVEEEESVEDVDSNPGKGKGKKKKKDAHKNEKDKETLKIEKKEKKESLKREKEAKKFALKKEKEENKESLKRQEEKDASFKEKKAKEKEKKGTNGSDKGDTGKWKSLKLFRNRKIDGMNLDEQEFRVGIKVRYKLHCEELGSKAPVLTCTPVEAAKVDVVKAPQFGDNTYWCDITPLQEGKMEITITYEDFHILGSPFVVNIGPRGDASQCHIVETSSSCQRQGSDTILFCVSVPKSAGKGKLTAIVKSVETKERLQDLITTVKSKHHYHVEFKPSQGLQYILNVKYDERHIVGSPFTINLGDPGRCVVHGEGVKQAHLEEENTFTVCVAEAGPGELTVTIEGEEDMVSPTIAATGAEKEYRVSYNVKKPGKYSVNVLWGGVRLPQSPYLVPCIAPYQFSLTETASQAYIGGVVKFKVASVAPLIRRKKLSVFAHPINDISKMFSGEISEEGRMFFCTLQPKVEGQCLVHICWDGSEIPGSPVQLTVVPLNVDDFQLNAAPTEDGSISVHVSGPKDIFATELISASLDNCVTGEQLPINVKRVSSEECQINFVPSLGGEYQLSMQYAGRHISGSPFLLTQADPEECRVWGEGVRVSQVGGLANFFVEHEFAGPGNLSVDIKGEREGVNFEPFIASGKGKSEVSYVCNRVGEYKVYVFWGEYELRGSPFTMHCVDPSKFTVSDPVPKIGSIEEPLKFVVQSNRPILDWEQLSVVAKLRHHQPVIRGTVVSKRSHKEPKLECAVDIHQKGFYVIYVRCRGINILGSPFQVRILPAPQPENVQLSGPGLRNGTVGEKRMFSIDVSGAGHGHIGFKVQGPSGGFTINMRHHPEQEGVVLAEYTPVAIGIYSMEVLWAGKPVPSSPFGVVIYEKREKAAEEEEKGGESEWVSGEE